MSGWLLGPTAHGYTTEQFVEGNEWHVLKAVTLTVVTGRIYEGYSTHAGTEPGHQGTFNLENIDMGFSRYSLRVGKRENGADLV